MPIGKKKTALIDANRKNSTIKRFEFPIDSTDCILRIRSLTFFSTSPISNKMWATLFFREPFSFSTNILPSSKTLYSCNRSRWDIHNLNTEGVNAASHIKYYTKRRQVTKSKSTYEKVNNEDSQLKKEKWYETIQNQLSHQKQILKKKTKVI